MPSYASGLLQTVTRLRTIAKKRFAREKPLRREAAKLTAAEKGAHSNKQEKYR
jgi:hypothetical protein